ncbi:oxytocin receptor-like [Scleropages formosus]|uniref:Oxytocin receptor-like n=1 Tax=Scleropages formosus TaxID=113540 RepID=A0A0P7X3V6_SCLFO|nr:oxytocin receptor-like [Scleropages formosus]
MEAVDVDADAADAWARNDSWRNWSWAAGGAAGNHSANPLKRNEEVAKVEVTVLLLVLLLALAGNVCVLLAIHTSKHGHSRMYYFMKHLSIADLVVAVFQVLPQLIWDITFRFYGPDLLCRLVKYLQVVGMFASTYMLVLMSIDRCLAICQPLRSLHRRKDRVSVLSSWGLSLLFSAPQVYIFSLKEVGHGVYDCWGDFVQPWGAKAYVTWISFTIYVIPVAILSACYGLISFKIWQNFKLKTKKEQCVAAPPFSRVSSVKLISKAKIRTVKMTFVIVVAYIVCWTPFFFVQMWSAWDPAAPREGLRFQKPEPRGDGFGRRLINEDSVSLGGNQQFTGYLQAVRLAGTDRLVTKMAFIIAMLLASLNSCCNPWIYMCFAGHLFHDLIRHFVCCSTRYLKSSPCSCEGNTSHRSNTSTFIIKSTSSQRSVTQTSTT